MSPVESATPHPSDSGAPARILAAIPAASGAVVMGTGIVSIALLLDGHEALSGILLVLAGVAWVALGAILADRALRDRERLRSESRVPAALTGVAGTGVLGTRLVLLGWDWAGIVLLVIALVLWLALVQSVLRNWVVPTFGASFILTVSTESLALLAATLAVGEHAHWLLVAALVPFVLGVAFYLFVLSRFEFRQLLVGRGDHWVSGGALAISTVVAGRITIAAAKLHMFTGHHALLEGIALGLWVATIAWLPVLLIAELAKPRLHYDVRRWSTVFPVGMYAACSFIVGMAIKAPEIAEFAEIWVWVAVAVWVVVFAGMLRRGLQLAGGEQQPTSSDRINELATSG